MDRDRDRDHDDMNSGMASRFQSLDEVIGQASQGPWWGEGGGGVKSSLPRVC